MKDIDPLDINHGRLKSYIKFAIVSSYFRDVIRLFRSRSCIILMNFADLSKKIIEYKR